LNRQLGFKARTDVIWYDKHGKFEENGFLIYLEGTYKQGFNFTANLRLQYFETDGYNSRLYAYERDVLYSYSIPVFFDKGFRYYINLNYDLGKRFSFWVKWAQTLYKDKESIGSGLDIINDSKRSDIKLQVRYLW
jgi:hypothetical protein